MVHHSTSGQSVWLNNLAHTMQSKQVIILHGNVKDVYVHRTPSVTYICGLKELLARLYWDQWEIFCYDAYNKAEIIRKGEGDRIQPESLPEYGTAGMQNTLVQNLARMYQQMGEVRPRPRIWAFFYTNLYLPFRNSYSAEEGMLLLLFQKMIRRLPIGDRMILVYLSESLVPVEFYQNGPETALVNIPLPEFEERMAYISAKLPGLSRPEVVANLTEGLALRDVGTIVQRISLKKEITHREIEKEIKRFKFGEAPDYYGRITLERLDEALAFFTEQEGIQGQNEAVVKVIEMIWKARTGVSNLLRSGSFMPPRGVVSREKERGSSTGSPKLCENSKRNGRKS